MSEKPLGHRDWEGKKNKWSDRKNRITGDEKNRCPEKKEKSAEKSIIIPHIMKKERSIDPTKKAPGE
jgi:hypothetical protein